MKFSVVLFDIRNDEMKYLDNYIRHSILQMFYFSYSLVLLLKEYFEDDESLEYEKLTNKTMISSLNYLESLLFYDLEFLSQFVTDVNLDRVRANS